MAFLPAAVVVLLIWLVLSLRDLERRAVVMIAALPFCVFAALVVSGLSILTAHLVAMLTLLVNAQRRARGRGDRIRIPTAKL